jgi:glutamate synthase (NADPH/NADH) small chain
MEVHDYGLITVVDRNTGATTREGVYAGGDVVTGPDLVVTAMVAGRKAAASIGEYLATKK